MSSLLPVEMRRLRQEVVDWRYKGFPDLGGRTLEEVPELGLDIFTGGFTLPIVMLKADELAGNIEWMSRLAKTSGALLAPHAKTTMSPQLVERQLQAGAWAVTVANVSQARIFLAFGASRMIIANEVVSATDIAWIAETMSAHPNVELFVLVDSVDAVRLLDSGLAPSLKPTVALPVLIELGATGGRAGARSLPQVLAIAEAVQSSSRLRLAGVEGFEGAVPGASRTEATPGISSLLREAKVAVHALSARGFLADEVIVTFGGSSYFDIVLDELSGQWLEGHLVSLVLRSGCYVTHDHGLYAANGPKSDGRLASGLQPAIEVWGSVLSCPEPGLAIAGFGRRDVSFDAGLPLPLRFMRSGGEFSAGDSRIVSINDQHVYVKLDSAITVFPGDVLVAGISHPCTTFDKWRLIPIVDSQYRVIDAIRTYF